MPKPTLQLSKLDDLLPDPENARVHGPDQVEAVAHSIRRFGWTRPVMITKPEQGKAVIRAGNGACAAAGVIYAMGESIWMAPGKDRGGLKLPAGTVPTIDCTGWTPEEITAYALADNKLALMASWDEERLRTSLNTLAGMDFNLGLAGFDPKELEKLNAPPPEKVGLGNMAREFLVPPFSVLNAREGWWQSRKRQWIALGIQSELGRGEQAAIGGAPMPIDRGKARAFGQDLMRKEGTSVIPGNTAPAEDDLAESTGTSIFDPVLCELIYKWFSPPAGLVIDPFAGGSVRGVVAGALGRGYIGMELRPEQVEANRAQAAAIFTGQSDEAPMWMQGDSAVALNEMATPGNLQHGADLIFSCPPYGNLERYSDDPADLSTMDQEAFDKAHAAIIDSAVRRLNDDRFAVWVVGDYRGPGGTYTDFIGRTVAAFRAAGAQLYNHAILVTAVGSLPIRTGKQFRATRKLGNTHQDVLVFVKGDPAKAAEACGPVEIGEALKGAADQAAVDQMAGFEVV